MACPLCRRGRARRACPAIGANICPFCCGTKRLTEIACPATCVYLEAAHRYPAAVVKKQQEHDIATLMTALGPLADAQLELFFVLQTFIARFAPPVGMRLVDADVAAAAGALAATYETAARGVVYEHPVTSPIGEGLRRELKARLDEIGRGGGSRFEREAAEVLRGIERGAAHGIPGVGDGPLDYLALVARLLQERSPGARATTPILLP